MVAVPSSLSWLRAVPGGPSWLLGLPALVEECRGLWDLRLGRPYDDSYTSLVLPAETPEGPPAVLKIQFPGRESEHEADALALWEGEGAVRLLGHDRARHALLIERCEPGTALAELPEDEALDVMVRLLPRLWRLAGSPFRPLAEEAAHWTESLPRQWEAAGRPFEVRLLQAALADLRDLPTTQGEQVLLHQDLHAANVLRATREPWLAIDPKPLSGEREFGISALVRGEELGAGAEHVRRRLDRLASELGLERDRARRWAFAQTLAWSFEAGAVIPSLVETARVLLEAA